MAQRSTPRTKDKPGGVLRDTVVVLVVALLLSVLTRTFLVQAFYVPSGSMLPTLQLDDRIVASKLAGSQLDRGDVVVFVDPGGWLAPVIRPGGLSGAIRSVFTWVGLLPSDADDNLVKRVIGLGGDHVVCCDKVSRIQVNGTSLDEPYLAPGGTAQVRFDIVVPPGRMFVMGDNRGHSEDSRFHLEVADGTVPLDHVVGPVVAIVWPVGHWQRLSPPAAFAAVPAAPPPGVAGAAGSSGVPPPDPAAAGEAGPGPSG